MLLMLSLVSGWFPLGGELLMISTFSIVTLLAPDTCTPSPSA